MWAVHNTNRFDRFRPKMSRDTSNDKLTVLLNTFHKGKQRYSVYYNDGVLAWEREKSKTSEWGGLTMAKGRVSRNGGKVKFASDSFKNCREDETEVENA